jgi:hypothetical protein
VYLNFWAYLLIFFLLDLLAFVVGFSSISTIIAMSRDSFAYMSCEKAHLLALNRNLAKFLLVRNFTLGWVPLYCFYSILQLNNLKFSALRWSSSLS